MVNNKIEVVRMTESLKDSFEKLKAENIIKGEYSNLESYFALKEEVNLDNDTSLREENKIKFLTFSRVIDKEASEIKAKYFKDEYHTIDHWIHNYLLAKEYYKEHKNLITSIGEVYEINGLSLKIDTWLISQRALYRNGQLRENQIKLLDEIEMVWYLDRRFKDQENNLIEENKQEPNQKSA